MYVVGLVATSRLQPASALVMSVISGWLAYFRFPQINEVPLVCPRPRFGHDRTSQAGLPRLQSKAGAHPHHMLGNLTDVLHDKQRDVPEYEITLRMSLND